MTTTSTRSRPAGPVEVTLVSLRRASPSSSIPPNVPSLSVDFMVTLLSKSNLGKRARRNFGRITHFAGPPRMGNSTHARPFSHQVVLVRERGRRGSRGDVRLVEDVAH